jgi:hypothetical protein
MSRADARIATASATSRREPHAHVASLSPRTRRPLQRTRHSDRARSDGPLESRRRLTATEARARGVQCPARSGRHEVEHGHRAPAPHSLERTTPRVRPAGSRGVTSARTSMSRANATIATAPATSRRAPHAYGGSLCPRTYRPLRVARSSSSCADARIATASATSRRAPHAYVASLSLGPAGRFRGRVIPIERDPMDHSNLEGDSQAPEA